MFSCTCHQESPEMVLDLGEQGGQPKVLPRFPDAGECQQVHHHFHGGSAKTSDSAHAFM